jgi:hypothetical protein
VPTLRVERPGLGAHVRRRCYQPLLPKGRHGRAVASTADDGPCPTGAG